MSLFGFGSGQTDFFQSEELNFISFEDLLSTSSNYVEVDNNKEDIFVEVVCDADEEDDEDFMFKSANTAILGQFASFEASMIVDRRSEDDSNGSGVRGCVYNSASYVCDYSKTTGALFGGDVAVAIENSLKHSLDFDPFASQGASKKRRLDVSLGCTPMVPFEGSFLSPFHFVLEGQSKDCVLSLMEDHLDNQEASFVYSEADSVWRVSVVDEDASHRQCEFVVSLFATTECPPDVNSTYLLEALHLYGDADVFRSSFEGIKSIFLDVDEVEDCDAEKLDFVSEDASFFAQNENRAALMEHIDMPVSDYNKDSIVSIALHQRRLQGVENICELSSKREMVSTLVEVGAVSALLTVFSHCVNDSTSEVECLDNAIIPSAICALSNLMHHKDAQSVMALDLGLVCYLRERVLASLQVHSDRLLRSDMSTMVRSMLVLLCRCHPEVVLGLLGLASLEEVFTAAKINKQIRSVVDHSPLVSTRSHKPHYTDSVSVDHLYPMEARGGLSSKLSAIHIN